MTKYRHPRLQSPGGFTLIELMIVVAILGVLISVATVFVQPLCAQGKGR
jgi:prepilin-type N-terminal cleavage/methylation domain-containing protein